MNTDCFTSLPTMAPQGPPQLTVLLHSQPVRHPHHKYVHIHEYDGQVFDLKADPGEWQNLLGRPEVADIETELRSHIFKNFDLDAIAEDNLDSLYRRQMINEAMQTNGVSWAHNPGFDPAKKSLSQYLT